MAVGTAEQNGTQQLPRIPIINKPCQGCQDRKDIFQAANWQIDAGILATIIIVGATIYLLKKNKIIPE